MSTEAWQWGELFELEVPDDAEVSDLGEMIQISWKDDPGSPLLLASLNPPDPTTVHGAPPTPELRCRRALEHFAASRAAPNDANNHIETIVDEHGVAAGRLAFVARDLAWLGLAVAWNEHLVVAFAGAPETTAPIFERAEGLIASLTPLDLVAPLILHAEPPSTF